MALLLDEHDRLISIARSGFRAKAEVSGVLRARHCETVLFVTSMGFREVRTGKPPSDVVGFVT